MRLCFCLVVASIAVNAQSQADAIREAMRKSIALQMDSVQRQRAAASSRTAVLAAPAGCDPLPAAVIEPMIAEVAKNERVQESIVREVARRESGFRPCAVSHKGALGIMQLMPETAEAFSVRDPFDARENMTAGGRFLRQLLDRYGGDIERALSAYNAGPSRVDQAGGVPNIDETREYVKNIVARLGAF